MILTKGEKRFIKANRAMLENLFLKRIKELEELAANLDPNLTAEEFKIKYLGYRNFINEMEEWLKNIRILDKNSKKEIDSGV